MFSTAKIKTKPLLEIKGVNKLFSKNKGCQNISFDLYPGEVLGIVGESGSGKSTLLNCISGKQEVDSGKILFNDIYDKKNETIDIAQSDEGVKRKLMREKWGFVEQNPRDGLRLNVSAGANIAERLMAKNENNFSAIQQVATQWFNNVELDETRINDFPKQFSGGMQQRLQIARTLVTKPKLVFMDEPTGGLDVSVQAKLLDLIKRLVAQYNLCVIIVTHDLAVARLLTLMKDSKIIESGLTDQILDDPRADYSQLLVSSILTV